MSGEEALLAAVRRGLGAAAAGEGVELGIGDDAAVLRPPSGRRLVATVDMQVEGQHFERRGPAGAPPADIGWRALAVNLSDVAAMGGEPRWALSSLGIPPDMGPPEVEALCAGLAEAASAFGVAVVGGNLARVPAGLVLDVTVLGLVDRAVPRSGGQPGDLVCVTGRLGAAAAGLAVARRGRDVPGLGDRARRELLLAQRRPQPRVREGIALGAVLPGAVHAMCDVSDGLTADLGRLCPAGLGATLWREALPVPASVRAAAVALGADALAWALGGGEDYELLCLVAPEGFDAARSAVARCGGAELQAIGECSPRAGLRLAEARGGEGRPLEPAGWDPFR